MFAVESHHKNFSIILITQNYKKATADKYQFLLVDCFPTTDDELRLQQSIFPDHNGVNWVFVPEEKGIESNVMCTCCMFYPLRVHDKERNTEERYQRTDKNIV
ncbi:hypothetical protein CEXT_719991 [Caerostris extrusa]|uniref:Uncharacterized protein n=1 Tax=Caerostris extrusa TaxID=172846 RepID=A0AAV4TD26_CAEEX|nr:uncharacterized protein CEXT_590241 [Caerostris extrusa]GIY41883.1 hypothetical protein CEXT_719991 [Caerostris extrusa]